MSGLVQREYLAWLDVVASEDVAKVSKLPLSNEASQRLHARPFVDFHVRDVVDLLDAEDYAQAIILGVYTLSITQSNTQSIYSRVYSE